MAGNRKARRRAAALAQKSLARRTSAKTVPITPHQPQLQSWTPSSAQLRTALLGTVAVGALVTAQPRAAYAGPDACTINGVVATCQGDQSDGITSQGGGSDFNAPPITTLNVNNLTQAITPGAGVEGIEFQSAGGDVTIVSDTGPFAITTTGNNAEGIFAHNSAGAGTVTVTSTGDITTTGTGAEGIFARDQDAGNATITSTGNISTGGNNSEGLEATDSGDGNATVTSTGNITTMGEDAEGIRARDNDDGNATVTSTGDISTIGEDSEGIEAFDSGDGNATVTSTGNITTAGEDAEGIRVRDNNDGNATATSTGNISTAGDDSRGIEARDSGAGNATVTSIGDISTLGEDAQGIYARDTSAGNATVTSTGNITTAGDTSQGIYVRDGSAGNATVTSTGNVATTGNYAQGIYARDGGAGNATVTSTGNVSTTGGYSQGIYVQDAGAGDVSVTSTGNISTTGDYSMGILAFDNNAGDISVTSTGDITTTGKYASGIFASENDDGNISVTSTGNITTAGGYSAAINVRHNGNGDIIVTSNGDITTTGKYSAGINARSSGDGDTTVTSTGNITTAGDNSAGVFALSYGNGNVTVSSTGNVMATGPYSIGILSASTGTGNATLSSTGDVSTAGDDSNAIYGYAGNGDVSITSTGNVSTTGAGSDGITGTSYGGFITITQTGDIIVTGDGSDAIDVNNAPGAGSSLITINAGSTITGGPGSGDGIDFSDGLTNRVVNFGTISTLGENAIEGEGGNETVDNFGVVTGDVDLAGGTNAFNNMAGGTFNSGMTVNLGMGNLLTNSGTLAPGGTGTIQTTALTGNLVQTGSGTFAVDLDLAAAATDRVDVSGTAVLAGTVAVNAINPALLTQQFTILSAAGGTTNNGLALGPISPVLQAQLLFPNATDVVLGIDVDFTPGDMLNPNQTNIGNNLNASLGAGGGNLIPIFNALLNGVFTLEDYKAALDQLSPEIFLNSETATLFSAEEFTNNLFSCRVAGVGYSFIAEGQCVWIRPEGRYLDRSRTTNNIGFDEASGAMSAGAQLAIAPGWFAGFGLGYETADLETSTGAESESDRFNIGGVLKYQSGPLLLAAAITGGIAQFDNTRRLNFGGFNEVARSDHDVTYAAAQFRAAYLLPQGNWYAKPLIDLNLTFLDRDSINEHGGGAANLNVAGGDDTYFSVTPAIEFGGEFAIAGGSLIQPFVKAGVTFFENDQHALTASFAGAPTGVGAFAISSEFDEVFADIEAGLTVLNGEGATLTFSYEGRISEDTDQHGVVLKGSSKF